MKLRWFNKEERGKRPSLFSIHGIEYFDTIDEAVNNSVTASQSVNLMADFVAGEPQDDRIVGGIKLNDLIAWASRQVAKYKGFVVHFDIDGSLKPKSIDLRDFKNYILVQPDSSGDTAVIRRKVNKTEVDYYKYSEDAKVISEQIERSGGILKHKGYVMYFPFEVTDDYPTPFIHPALPLALSEKASGLLKYNALKRGTFNNTLIIVNEFANKDALADFTKNVKLGMGEEGVNGVAIVETAKEGDKLEEDIIIKEINSGFDSKILQYTDNQAQQKIASCFKNIPIDLISQNSGMFQGGEKIVEMRKFYDEQTLKERKKLEECINEILRIFGEQPIVLNSILKEEENEQNIDDTATKTDKTADIDAGQ